MFPVYFLIGKRDEKVQKIYFEIVAPDEESFSGFTFKIQANMDPAHRDRIAFFRICSGKFTRGMKVKHHTASARRST